MAPRSRPTPRFRSRISHGTAAPKRYRTPFAAPAPPSPGWPNWANSTCAIPACCYRDPLRRPRGVLLLSPPGCGKSQFCKALGNETGRPTLVLDVGSLMGLLVGATEANTGKPMGSCAAVDLAWRCADDCPDKIYNTQVIGVLASRNRTCFVAIYRTIIAGDVRRKNNAKIGTAPRSCKSNEKSHLRPIP